MLMSRRLGEAELPRVDEIDDSDDGDVVLVQHGSLTEPRAETWHRPRTGPAGWAEHIQHWLAFPPIDRMAIGAFDEDRLVGIAVVRLHLEAGMAQLAALFVDRAHRRQGVAATLTAAAEDLARDSGATTFYVSAIPSETAVGFYRRYGFAPTTERNAELLALEPDDIHMRKSVRGSG